MLCICCIFEFAVWSGRSFQVRSHCREEQEKWILTYCLVCLIALEATEVSYAPREESVRSGLISAFCVSLFVVPLREKVTLSASR